jgi:spore coat polysaccharide biosynthesis protein SpsF
VRRVVAIIQARTTSTRLPGKVLMDLAGRPLLERQLERLRRAATLSEIVVATTTNPTDDDVAALAEGFGAGVFRGSESDVLRRYAAAAREARADVVVRVTADCPLLDPGVVDRVVGALTARLDYASNVVRRTFPQGLDVEAMHADVLARVDRAATSDDAREHVSWFIHHERPDLFEIASVEDEVDNSDLRWTVDHAEDLELVRRLYSELDLAETMLPYGEVVDHVRRR